MDGFMDVDELFHLRNLFYQGAYDQVINDSHPQGQNLRIRALIAKGEISKAFEEIEKLSPSSSALKLLAEYSNTKSVSERSSIADKALSLNTETELDSTSLIAIGSILYNEGRLDDSLKILQKHEKNLEAVALIVQIHLYNNRVDLARKEYNSAKQWADDSLLIQLIEAWVSLKSGGTKYQEAYYVYEELGTTPSGASISILNGQAICQIHLHRYPEAISALEEALKINPNHSDTLANLIVVYTLSGEDSTEYLNTLKSIAPNHFLVKDLQEKSTLFDSVAVAFAKA